MLSPHTCQEKQFRGQADSSRRGSCLLSGRLSTAGEPESAACFPGPLGEGAGVPGLRHPSGGSSGSERGEREHRLSWMAFQFSLPAGARSPSLSSEYSLAKAILAFEEGGPSFCLDNRRKKKPFSTIAQPLNATEWHSHTNVPQPHFTAF